MVKIFTLILFNMILILYILSSKNKYYTNSYVQIFYSNLKEVTFKIHLDISIIILIHSGIKVIFEIF